MESLLIKKFNEYFSEINLKLTEFSINLSTVFLADQLLDRLGKVNRKTIMLNRFVDEPGEFCTQLEEISVLTEENCSILDEYIQKYESEEPAVLELRKLLFLMNDLFYQAQMLIKSVVMS